MDSQVPKYKVLAAACPLLSLFLFLSPCFAGEVDVDMFGLTYHLHKRGAVHDAPLKLDQAGYLVFNPGLGLGYDFRENRQNNGFSATMHVGMFENCNNHPYSFVAAGGRYRKYFHKKTFFEANLMGALTYGNDSDNKRYKFSPTPYVNVGLGHDYGKYSITYYLSYVPRGSGGGITSSTDMLFLSAALSF